MSADDVADTTGCNRRLVREWLDGQAAGGLIGYDVATDLYELSPEAELALADDSSPAFVARAMNAFGSMFIDLDKITTAFRGDGALSWGDHHPCLFSGTEWFFRTGYRAELPSWVAALDGVAAKLDAGATVADVGCGHGASAIVLAQAYPERPHPRLRLPRAVDHDGTGTGRGGGRVEPDDVRGRRRQGLRRLLRPDLLLRLPARHGRSGGHRRRTPAAALPTAARSCSSSRSPSTTATATSPRTRWPRCCTRRRRASARRTRCRRRSGSASARRPARRGSATCSRRPGSPTSGVAAETPLNLILEARV